MYEYIAYVIIIGSAGVAALHWLVCPCDKKRSFGIIPIIRLKLHIVSLFLLEQKYNLVGRLKKLVYLVTLFAFAVLFITGFVQRLILGVPLHGYTLMLHATFAPVFMVCSAISVFGYAQQCRFTSEDWDWIMKVVTFKWSASECRGCELGRKASFWGASALILPVALSMIASMYPIFGTHMQEVLFELHRYGAVLLTGFAVFHVYLTMRMKLKQD